MRTIFVCFFGITRSLPFTIASIQRNVLGPAASFGQVRIFAHLFKQDTAIAPSGRPEGRFALDDPTLLGAEYLEQEAPEDCLGLYNFDVIRSYGDSFGNNFSSLRNLIHQLHSLSQVTKAAVREGANTVVFCRPDLRYHDSLGNVIEAAVQAQDQLFLPSWQAWGGYNDRFAVATGQRAIIAYGERIDSVPRYLSELEQPLHSERLVRFALESAGINVTFIQHRASRVRASGAQIWESFQDGDAALAHEIFKAKLWRLLELTGTKPIARMIFKKYMSFKKRVRRERRGRFADY